MTTADEIEDVIMFDGNIRIVLDERCDCGGTDHSWATALMSMLKTNLQPWFGDGSDEDMPEACIVTAVDGEEVAVEIYYDGLHCNKETHQACFCLNNIANWCPDRLHADVVETIIQYNKLAVKKRNFDVHEHRNFF